MGRPTHLRLDLVALVALGGVVGTLARYGLAEALPSWGSWPLATLTANLSGSALLGILLEALVREGPETQRTRMVRLTLGTGVLGGFTTFSSLAYEIEHLVADGDPGMGVAYGLGSIALGLAACFAGVAWAAARQRKHVTPLPADPDAAERLDATGGE